VSLEIKRPWQDLDPAVTADIPAQLGVYQISDAVGTVLFVGFAGGRAAFGLRGVLTDEARQPRPEARRFRCEVTMQYTSRWQELLMAHVARAGALPRDNVGPGHQPYRLGRLSPV